MHFENVLNLKLAFLLFCFFKCIQKCAPQENWEKMTKLWILNPKSRWRQWMKRQRDIWDKFCLLSSLKILLSTKKLLFCISHFQKEFHFFWKRLHMIINHICLENYVEPAFDDPQSVNRTLTCVWACDNYTSSTTARYLIVVDGVYYIATTMISSDNDIGVIFCVNCCPTYLTAYDTYLIIKSRPKSRKQWG